MENERRHDSDPTASTSPGLAIAAPSNPIAVLGRRSPLQTVEGAEETANAIPDTKPPNAVPAPGPNLSPGPKTADADAADPTTATDNSVAATTTTNTTPVSAPAASFGVSTDGSCPYCRSSWVRYLVLVDPADEAPEHSLVLTELLAKGYATQVQATAAIPEPSSFICNSCQYGFNLDWDKTSLERIFYYALDAATAPSDPTHWSSDRTQWALTQQHWQGGGPSKSVVDARASALETVLDKIDNNATVTVTCNGAGLTTAFAPASTPHQHQHQHDPAAWVVLRRCKWECGEHAPAVGGGGCWAHRDGSCPSVHHDQSELLATLDARETASGHGASGGASGASGARYVTDFQEYSASANFGTMHGGFSKQSNDEYWAEKGVSKNRDLRMLGHFMDASHLVEAPVADPGSKRRKLSKEEVRQFKEKKKRRKFERDTAYLRS